jgi:hypothetical protein
MARLIYANQVLAILTLWEEDLLDVACRTEEVWVVQASRITWEGVRVEVDFNKGLHRYTTQALEEDLTSTTTSTLVEEVSTLEVVFKGGFNRITMDSQLTAICKMFKAANLQSATILVDSKAKGRISKGILQTTKQ